MLCRVIVRRRRRRKKKMMARRKRNLTAKVKMERRKRCHPCLLVLATPAGAHGLPETTLAQVNTDLFKPHSKRFTQNLEANTLNIFLHGPFPEGRTEMNGHGSRSSRRERRYQSDSDRATSQGSERGREITVRRSLKRKTARAAVNKIKLLEASDEDYEDEVEKPRRSSSRLRHTVWTNKRTAVLQSSSESEEEPSTQGRR